MTINYVYDPLNRLKEANYSTGDYYHYTYDTVGNRLSQQSMVNGQSSTVAYQYDIANRLTDVNGVTYTWDDNGNLLSDGTNSYTYDSANRLISVNGTTSYSYNGLGDRLTQNNIHYALDLNAGLTQVLSDGTSTYLYGVDRIAQVNSTSTDYFLGDALGSVRQLTDASGAATLAQAYDPYGVTLGSVGSSATSYGFTGEMADSYIKLIYLRSRYYIPSTGHFLTRDMWAGNSKRPMSYNLWGYVYDNPLTLTDPTGHYGYDRARAVLYARRYDRDVPLDLSYVAEDGQTYRLYQYADENLCTSFISMALWNAGVRDRRPDPRLAGVTDGPYYKDYPGPHSWWSKEAIRVDPNNYNNALYPYKVLDPANSWSNTNAFYSFITSGDVSINARVVLDVDYQIPHYYGRNETDLGANSADWEARIARAWQSGSIEWGDIVFYDYRNGPEWDHAALVDGWGNQTYHTEDELIYCVTSGQCDCSIPKPRVIEKSGRVRYGYGGRSIDNTFSTIRRIRVLHLS